MRFKVDHDYHIHTRLSSCSKSEQQTPQRLLQYAVENRLSAICVTDHFWDETMPGASNWYMPQNYAHIKEALPLPKADGVAFLFGCETELDKHMTLGISKKVLDELDFVIIPTTHLHMSGFTIDADIEPGDYKTRAGLYVSRLRGLMEMELPFEKIGIAHLTCRLIAREPHRAHIDLINEISDDTFKELFGAVAKKGAGVELNFNAGGYTESELAEILRPYRIAAACGCKFYLGSDAHGPDTLDTAKQNFESIIDALNLTEDQKFHIKSGIV